MAKYEAEFTYTDQELLDLYRQALAKISVAGQDYMIAGRRLTQANLKEVREQITWLEGRVNQASGIAANFARLNRR